MGWRKVEHLKVRLVAWLLAECVAGRSVTVGNFYAKGREFGIRSSDALWRLLKALEEGGVVRIQRHPVAYKSVIDCTPWLESSETLRELAKTIRPVA